MSHHLDSPIARQDIRLDITDLYVFRGEVGTVFIINVCHSIFGEIPSPGYHPEGMYEFKVDLNGDAVEELTYRITFDERDAAGKQRYTLRRITGAEATDPNAPGTVVLTGTTGETASTAEGLRFWASKAGDPFWIEPDVLHAVGHAFQDGTKVDLTGWDPAKAHNLFAGHDLLAGPGSAGRRARPRPQDQRLGRLHAGDGRRRLALHQPHRPAHDAAALRPSTTRTSVTGSNAGRPSDDFKTYGETITKHVAGCVAAIGTAEDPQAYAEYVAHRLLPNVLPYTVGTPAVLGFAEWNGRSLTDNAPDVMFSFASNSALRLGIGKESVTRKPTKTFPYVAPVS